MTTASVASAEWLVEVRAKVESLANAYDADMDRLEQQRKQAQGRSRQQVQHQIEGRRQELLRDLKGGRPTGPGMLVSGLIDYSSIWVLGDFPREEDAREAYINAVKEASSQGLELPSELKPALAPDFTDLSDRSWVGLKLTFIFERPWYSKDDRALHVLDNPVRKDPVFGVPYMAAASWKGMLRWACRMRAGLHDHLAKSGGKLNGWQDPKWILHLFGNEKGETDRFQQGALVFYPTWFDRIGFEVINPHSRARRAGTQPIYYEVVPAETKGFLRLLYAPSPGAIERDGVKPEEAIEKLLDGIESLLTTYGISAKRTVGWGTAKIEKWKGFREDQTPIEKATLQEFKDALRSWFAPDGDGS